MASIQLQCPICGAANSVDPQSTGAMVYCMRCGKPFRRPDSPASYTMPAQQGANGFAIASLVCGIVMCIPVCGPLAIIFGAIGAARAKDGRYRGKVMSLAGLVLGCIACIAWGLIIVTFVKVAPKVANILVSQVELNQIGFACRAYAADNNGAYPPDLGTLARVRNLPPQTFILPGSGTKVPTDLSPDQTAQWINDNADYEYVGKGLTSQSNPRCVVATENASSSRDDKVGVLFLDGHTEVVTLLQLQSDLLVNHAGATSP